MSLLTMCQDASIELGIAFPSSIVAANNADSRLLLRMAKKEVNSLRQRAYWQALRKEHTFNSLAAADQGATSFPADYDTLVIETAFNRTRRMPLLGPLAPQEWATIQAGLITAVEPSFMIRANRILMSPTPPAGQSIAYEYISKHAVLAGATPKLTFTVDTDTCVFDEEIVTQGIIWRWRKHKGMAFEDERLDYETLVMTAIMRDGSRPRIQLDKTQVRRPGRAYIRDYNTI